VKKISRSFLDLLIATMLIAFDQVTKVIATLSLTPERPVPIFSLFGIELSWTLTTNLGAAWGMLTDIPAALLLLRLFFIALLGGLYAISKTTPHTRTAIALIIAGALSNILDTFYWGHVVDMIHFRFWGWDYPIFNVADICICIGAAAIIWASLFHKDKKA